MGKLFVHKINSLTNIVLKSLPSLHPGYLASGKPWSNKEIDIKGENPGNVSSISWHHAREVTDWWKRKFRDFVEALDRKGGVVYLLKEKPVKFLNLHSL